MPALEGFCIVCKCYRPVKRLKKCYQCKVCGAKHRVVIHKGEPHFVSAVDLSNKKVSQSVVIIATETIYPWDKGYDASKPDPVEIGDAHIQVHNLKWNDTTNRKRFKIQGD